MSAGSSPDISEISSVTTRAGNADATRGQGNDEVVLCQTRDGLYQGCSITHAGLVRNRMAAFHDTDMSQR